MHSIKKGLRKVSGISFVYAVIFSMFSFLFVATTVFAGVAGSTGPTYPVFANVGATNVPVSVQITNNSTSPQDTETVLVTNILHTPSCGSGTSGICQLADADPGVFQINGPVTGRAGTACAGNTFTIGVPDVITGEVQFTPNAPIVLGPSSVGGSAAQCTIDFTVDVLKVPTKDSSVGAGAQTSQLARVLFTAQTTQVEGSASGSSQITVNKASPSITTIPGAGGPIGTVLNDTATLSGGLNPTGSVTFKLFPPSDALCVGTPSYTDTDLIAPYATSPGFISNVAGVWHWSADYSGDANNNAASSPCSAEPVTVLSPGRIIVDKITNPSGDSQSFTFNTTGTGYTGFSLTDTSAVNDQTLNAGTYSVAETAVSGWTQTSASCISSNADIETPASISLQAGETVTCTFTNTKKGHIIVNKITSPSGNPTSFVFTTSGTGYNGFNLTDVAAPNDQTLDAGTFSVAETPVSGWTQTSATCVSSKGDIEIPASISLQAGETVTCTFVNTQIAVAQGCSPGYWKQSQHFGSYPTGIYPNTLFSTVFGGSAFTGKSLLQVLSTGGGGQTALGRIMVSAYLNSSTVTGFPYTPTQVIAAFNGATPSTYGSVKSTFEALQGPCPFGRNPGAAGPQI